MDDVTANAMALARHERILARARSEREREAASGDFAGDMVATAAPAATPIAAISPPPASAPAASIAAPLPAPSPATAVAERPAQPVPTLTTSQLDQLASAFAPAADMPEDAPLDSRPQPVADPPAELSGDQAALLMSSFGVANAGQPAAVIPPGANAASGIPVASAAARSLVSDTDPAAAIAANLGGLPPDQQALLAASFGVNGAATLSAAEAAAAEEAALLPIAPTPLSPPGAAAVAEPRFFPTSPDRSAGAAAAANATATDAYLRTLRTVNGRYGLDGANGR